MRLAVRNSSSAPAGLAIPSAPEPRDRRPHQAQVTINGLTVHRVPAANGELIIDVPSLVMRLTATGPLARRALATLAPSPLEGVFSGRKESALQAGWRRHVFGGIRFAAPVQIPPLARIAVGQQGVVVGAGPIEASEAYQACGRTFSLHHICGQISGPFGTVYLVCYEPPGRTRPDAIYIGLAGTGATAKTIFDSIRPAPRH